MGSSDVGKGVVLRLNASLERFELSTRCLEGSCSVQLSYRDPLFTLNLASHDFKVKEPNIHFGYLIDTVFQGY